MFCAVHRCYYDFIDFVSIPNATNLTLSPTGAHTHTHRMFFAKFSAIILWWRWIHVWFLLYTFIFHYTVLLDINYSTYETHLYLWYKWNDFTLHSVWSFIIYFSILKLFCWLMRNFFHYFSSIIFTMRIKLDDRESFENWNEQALK